ncbi:endoplasmic reticulum metallopeptidase 1 [Nilaparvata lugens]|uniref:endoplasmic reticulum metallopeptidase 1 n=1 Tax=Nilaparvata lugens TaxID=108931 RepID=UPI00193E17BD|nr:endoplasmic reticulum metallopeptidase 1 [Nilaparvata lugens]
MALLRKRRDMMLRQRTRGEDEENVASVESADVTRDKRDVCVSRVTKMSALLLGVGIAALWLTMYSVAVHFNGKMPAIRLVADEKGAESGRFVGERAKTFLAKLSGVGVKVTGSHANEVLAVRLIEAEIAAIMAEAATDARHAIATDRQTPSGSFYLAFSVGFLSHYSRVQNVVVKIGPRREVNASLLVNCHFDSAPTSPGASDDGLNCAVMLETLRVLSQQKEELQHNIIFLFNGAEETPLQASHGFIAHHPWAKEVKAFVNLESCGAGGHEFLFQTGPGHSWLVELYADAAEHPSGTVLGEDIFQSGLVPSDTDFRVFRDYGKIPGLDFAHCDNGFVYHTRYDDIDQIQDGVYQHTGDNLLALIRKFSNSEKLTEAEQYKEGRAVYFDVLGLHMVVYSETVGIIVNLAVVMVSLCSVLQSTFTYTSGMSRKQVVMQLMTSVANPLLGIVTAVCFALATAVLLDALCATNGWYSRQALIVPLYMAPTLLALCLPPLLLNKFKSVSFRTTYRTRYITYDSLQEHMKHLNVVFKRLKTHQLKIQLDKTEFFKKELLFLGFDDSELFPGFPAENNANNANDNVNNNDEYDDIDINDLLRFHNNEAPPSCNFILIFVIFECPKFIFRDEKNLRREELCKLKQLMWTIVLFLAILTGFRSAYLIMLAVVFTASANCLLALFNCQHSVRKWLTVYLCSSMVPGVYFVYIYVMAMTLFVPISGRSGPNVNPDLIIGVIASLLCCLIFGYLSPLILLVWKPWRLILGIFAVYFVAVLAVIATPLGFPFSQQFPERILMFHVERNLHNISSPDSSEGGGGGVSTDSGLWLYHMDRRAPHTYSVFPWFNNLQNVDIDCEKYIYCGMPFYYSRSAKTDVNPGSWIPVPPPKFENDTLIKVTAIENVEHDLKRYTFSVHGPNQMRIFLSPKQDVNLVSWDFASPPEPGPKWGDRLTYMISHTTGLPSPAWNFSIDLRDNRPAGAKQEVIDVAISGHYVDSSEQQKKDLLRYTKYAPEWAHFTAWAVQYRAYVF